MCSNQKYPFTKIDTMYHMYHAFNSLTENESGHHKNQCSNSGVFSNLFGKKRLKCMHRHHELIP